MEVIMSVININLFSMMLRRTIDVTVVLPDKINDDEKLPCVWLYHGGSGDHTEWLYHTSLVDTVNERHFAAVLPEVFESCFVNMNIGDRYESFVAKELPSTIHNMFACRFSSVQFPGKQPQLAIYSLSSYTLIWIGTPD